MLNIFIKKISVWYVIVVEPIKLKMMSDLTGNKSFLKEFNQHIT